MTDKRKSLVQVVNEFSKKKYHKLEKKMCIYVKISNNILHRTPGYIVVFAIVKHNKNLVNMLMMEILFINKFRIITYNRIIHRNSPYIVSEQYNFNSNFI